MSEKYLIVGATGSIGSSLAAQLYESGKEIHLVGRDENQTKSLSEKLNSEYSIADVLDDGFVEFDELRVSGVNKQILERYSNNFNSERKNILNKIIFRNAIKEFFKKISGD